MSIIGLAQSLTMIWFGPASIPPSGRTPSFIDQILAFLHQLWDSMEPYLGPIYDVLDSEYTQSILLTAVVGTVVFVCGMIFVLYEGGGIIHALTGGSLIPAGAAPSKDSSSRRAQPSERPSSAQAQTKREVRPTREVESAGVAVRSTLVKDLEGYLLSVDVHNRTGQHIDMVVVDTDLPVGVDSRVGSFRMQRLGTINAGESKTARFALDVTSGTLSEVRGYVEFMSASYEISRIEIPVPEPSE